METGIITKTMNTIPLKRPEVLTKLGLEPTRGVLLVGPPGTGKTLTARALAEEIGVNYIAIVGPEVISKYYGEAEQRLRALFEKAAKNAPCIVFIALLNPCMKIMLHDSKTLVPDVAVQRLYTRIHTSNQQRRFY